MSFTWLHSTANFVFFFHFFAKFFSFDLFFVGILRRIRETFLRYLSIVRNIIHRHYGEKWEAMPDGGSRFRIEVLGGQAQPYRYFLSLSHNSLQYQSCTGCKYILTLVHTARNSPSPLSLSLSLSMTL